MANITSEAQIDRFSAGVTLAVISTVSLMSNILLVVVVGKRRKSRLHHAERFLTLYGCLEGTYASVPAVLSTVSYLSHRWSVNANEVICDFHGWISFATKCSCVVVTTSLLLERYLEKSRPERNGRRIPKRLFHVSVCGVAASGLLAAVPVITGHKMASFEPSGSYCHFDYKVTTIMSRVYSISIVIIGYIFLQAGSFCYISLCCERRRKGRDKTRLLGFHSEINGNILNHVTDSNISQQRTKERGVHRCVSGGDDVQPWQQRTRSFDDDASFTATVLAVVTIQWLCYLPFLIVIVMAQTGYDVTSELNFAVVRMLSIDGALNPLVFLWSFPPFRLIIQNLLCGRCSNGGEKKKQNKALYEPDPKHVSQSVVYDSTLDDAPSWYLSRPNRSLPKSYSTGDLISQRLEDSTKGPHHRASVRSILIPSKSSEFLPSPHRHLEKPRRSIHWEDDVMSYPGINGDMSRVILVRQGADGVKAGGESICYVNEEDSFSSEMSSQSDDWTTDSDEDPLPVYVINGKAYYIDSMHQNDGNKRCALCDCKEDAGNDDRMHAVQETHQRASNSPDENGRVRGRAEQRAARCEHPAAETSRKVTLSVRPKSTKPRVLRKQAERLKKIKNERGEMREQSEMTEVAVISNVDDPQVHDRNLEYSANIMNSSQNVDMFSRDTIHEESASNLPLYFYQHERNATNPVFINGDQRNVYHPENHIAQCVGSRQHGAVETISLNQGYSIHDYPDLDAIKEDEHEVLGLGCRQNQGAVDTNDQRYSQEVLGQGGAVQDRFLDLKKAPQMTVPYEVDNTDYNEVSPGMLRHDVVLIGAETGQETSHVTPEIPHLGRGMDSLKHLEIHCEQLLQRSLSFRNDIDRDCEKTAEVITTTEISNITDSKYTFAKNPQGSQQVPSQTVADTPIQLDETLGSHVVSKRRSEDFQSRDEHTLHRGAVANEWNSSRSVCTNEANCKTEVSTVQSNRRTIQNLEARETNGNYNKGFSSYYYPRDIVRSKSDETKCGHVSEEAVQVLHHRIPPADGEAQIVTENLYRVFKKEPQNTSVSANGVPINMTDDRYDGIDNRAANHSVSIDTQPFHHPQNQYNIVDGKVEESNTKIETPVAILVNSGSVSDIPLTRGDGTRNGSSQPVDQQSAHGLRSGETDIDRGFNKLRVSDQPLEKDIVFHGLTSEDPQVINLLFQKVIMRPEQPVREEPLSEAVGRAAEGEIVVGKLNGPTVTLKTRENFQEKPNIQVAGESVPNQMAVNVRNDHSYSETTTASSNVAQPGGDVDEGSPGGDITYRHFLRAINLTPAKKQPGNEQTTVPSISVTPSDNDVNWASESDDSMSSDGSVASLFCKPPMLKLGSKRRKGKHNLTIPYWLNAGSGSGRTNDDQSNGGQVGNDEKSPNNSETMPNLPENKLSGIHYFECEESDDSCRQRKTSQGTDYKLTVQPKDVDFQLVPDSINRSPTNGNTDSTIKRDNTRLGFQQTHKDFDETNSSGGIPLSNKSSKQDKNASKSTETHTDQNFHSGAETTSSPSPTNPAPKRRRSHSLDTSGFLDLTPVTQITNNCRNDNVLVTETPKMTNKRARRTSLPQHMLSKGTRPFVKSEIL